MSDDDTTRIMPAEVLPSLVVAEMRSTVGHAMQGIIDSLFKLEKTPTITRSGAIKLLLDCEDAAAIFRGKLSDYRKMLADL